MTDNPIAFSIPPNPQRWLNRTYARAFEEIRELADAVGDMTRQHPLLSGLVVAGEIGDHMSRIASVARRHAATLREADATDECVCSHTREDHEQGECRASASSGHQCSCPSFEALSGSGVTDDA